MLDSIYRILSNLVCFCSLAGPAASLLPPKQPSEASQPGTEELKKKIK